MGSHWQHPGQSTSKMPSTPQMRKANEKNAKNVTKRGQVKGTSKDTDKYPVSPELIALFVFCHRLRRLPNHSVRVDGWTVGVTSPLLQLSAEACGWVSQEAVSSKQRTQCKMVAPWWHQWWHHCGTIVAPVAPVQEIL